MTNVMIDYDVNPKVWFKVILHTDDFQNHGANKGNEDILPLLIAAKGEIGYITLLTTFHFNQDVLYQEYTSKFPKEGGNEKFGQWYGRSKYHGDGMCIFFSMDGELPGE